MESTSEEAMDYSPIESLSTEILQKILSDLPVRDRVRLERVCKRWKNVSTERLWKDVQVLILVPWYCIAHRTYDYPSIETFGEVYMKEDNKLYIDVYQTRIVRSIVPRVGQHIKEFIFSSHFDIEYVVSIIATHCHNIESLQLLAANDKRIKVISRLLEINKKLHSIACYSLPVENIIETLPLRDWKTLHLRLPNMKKEQWESKMIPLIENSPSLKELSVEFWTPNIQMAISNCKQLKKLVLLRNIEVIADEMMMDTSLLNRLTCLKIMYRLDENRMINLLRHCINLESLQLYCWDVELPNVFSETVLALPKFDSLELYAFGISDDILSRLLRFKHLKLYFQYKLPYGMSENGLFEMIKNSKCLENLEILNTELTPELFKKLARNSRKGRRILKLRVDRRIYQEALEICRGSGIHIYTAPDDVVFQQEIQILNGQ